MKRWLGLDTVTVLLHAGVTVCVAVALGGLVDGPAEEETAMATVFGASLLVLAYRRAKALRRADAEHLETGGAAGRRLQELEERLEELEQLYPRVLELEERVDFSERLLARGRGADEDGAPRPAAEGGAGGGGDVMQAEPERGGSRW